MKHLKIMSAVLIVMLAMAMPSISAAQYHEERLDHFLSEHPGLKAQLERNPSLIYDRRWRHEHPDLQEFMQKHPNVWGKLAGSNRWGAYGPDRDWHDADWWHEHDRGWMYKNHPEWVENHPDWRDEGDFDEHHEWHDRDWWNDHHPDWVQSHHPNWYKHEQHQAAKEQRYQEKQQNQEAKQQGHAEKHGHHGKKGD